jgi:quercetin dioxygenase-like cupin family protein
MTAMADETHPAAGRLQVALPVASAAIPWRAFADAPGVEYKVLRRHATAGGLTLLLRFAPGADYPAHRHPAGEEYFVLEGSLEDGGRTYRTGDYVYYPPGSAHRPASREGSTLLVLLPAAIERI